MSGYKSSISVGDLGYFLDGWADLIEGMGEKAEEVKSATFKSLRERQMPDIQVEEYLGSDKLTAMASRDYVITSTFPGASTAIYVAKFGKDLYVSWRTFIRPVLNKTLLLIALGICAFLGLITGGTRETGGFYTKSQTTFSFGGWIGWTIAFVIVAVLILGFVGRFWKGNVLAYFFVEPTVFDADDITAMSFSAHKSILRALDSTGFDISKLRLKQTFKGGRRGEDV